MSSSACPPGRASECASCVYVCVLSVSLETNIQCVTLTQLYHPTSLPAEALAVVLPGLTLPGRAAWDWPVVRLAGGALLPYPGGHHVYNLLQ